MVRAVVAAEDLLLVNDRRYSLHLQFLKDCLETQSLVNLDSGSLEHNTARSGTLQLITINMTDATEGHPNKNK